MKVLIDKRVHQAIDEFYEYVLLSHEALDEMTILLEDGSEVVRIHDVCHSFLYTD